MRKIIWITLSAMFLFTGCISLRSVSPEKPESQASVRIGLRDGSYREGIIFKGDSLNLHYIDAASHNKQSILINSIKQIKKLEKFYDFSANEIPQSEISQYKSHKHTWLYGSAGFLLGAAVGIGVGIGFYAADQPLAANASILVFGALGAWYFADKGNFVDSEDAAFTARKHLYEKEEAIMSEKEKIRQLQQEKNRVLKEIEDKKKEKGSPDK